MITVNMVGRNLMEAYTVLRMGVGNVARLVFALDISGMESPLQGDEQELLLGVASSSHEQHRFGVFHVRYAYCLAPVFHTHGVTVLGCRQ